jgi:YVTN family beta-propeller protein
MPEIGRGFSSNGEEAKTSVVDLKTLKTLSKVDIGESLETIVYEPKHGELYVFNHRGNSVTVIEAKTAKVVATISLGGSPDFAAVDPAASGVFVNIEDKNEVAAIDTATHAMVAHWPLAPGESPSGIAYGATHHRLFSTCDKKLLTMLDTKSGKIVGTAPIGDGPDGGAFSEKRQLTLASCGEGLTTIAHEDAPDKLTVVQTLKTERRARTMALDPTTEKIYLPTAQFEPAPTPAPGAPRQRPKIVPNTFKVLVYAPSA